MSACFYIESVGSEPVLVVSSSGRGNLQVFNIHEMRLTVLQALRKVPR